MSRHRRATLWVSLSFLIVAMGAAGASVSVAQGPSPAAAQDCLPPTNTDPDASSAIDGETVTDSAGDQLRVVEVATGLDPAGIAVDATDEWGRVFVADRGSDQLTVLYGRSPDLTVACRYPVPVGPVDVAVDDETGTV